MVEIKPPRPDTSDNAARSNGPGSVQLTFAGPEATVLVTGEIDLYNASDLRAAGLDAVRDTETTLLVVDLGGVTFMDSTGLSALVTIRNEALYASKPIELRRLSDTASRLLTITALNETFGIPAYGGNPF